MKTNQLLTILATCTLLTLSCSKENKTDFEVNVVENNNSAAMTSGNTLNITVVNEFDPICGMDNATHLKDTANYEGKTYGFCNPMCKEKFLENPAEHIHE